MEDEVHTVCIANVVLKSESPPNTHTHTHAMEFHRQGLPGVRPCPEYFNPASWMLDVLAGTDSSDGTTIAATDAAAAKTSLPEGPWLQAAFFSSGLWQGTPASLAAIGSGHDAAADGDLAKPAAPAPPSEGLAAVLARQCEPAPGSTPLSFSSQRARSVWVQVRRPSPSLTRHIPAVSAAPPPPFCSFARS